MSSSSQSSSQQPTPPSATSTLGAMWVFTLLRLAVFGAMFGLLLLARVPGFWAAVIALILSVPLSFVLLSKQRQKLVDNIEQRVEAGKAKNQDLDNKLSGGED